MTDIFFLNTLLRLVVAVVILVDQNSCNVLKEDAFSTLGFQLAGYGERLSYNCLQFRYRSQPLESWF